MLLFFHSNLHELQQMLFNTILEYAIDNIPRNKTYRIASFLLGKNFDKNELFENCDDIKKFSTNENGEKTKAFTYMHDFDELEDYSI